MHLSYKNYFLMIVFLAISFTDTDLFAQQKKKITTSDEGLITYSFRSNGKEIKGAPLRLFFKNNIARLVPGKDPDKKEAQFIDYNNNVTWQILTLKNGSRYSLKTPFSKYEKAVLTGDTASILGYKCRKAKVIIRSNTIEIWFTDKLVLKGSPSLGVAPGLGLILKTVRNGNFETCATKVELKKVNDSLVKLPVNIGSIVGESTYRRKEIDNRFITVPVFSQQQINFTDSLVNPADKLENVTYRYAGGTLVLKKIKLPDSQDFSVFADLSEYSNGDAYDRTGSVFVIPTSRGKSFLDGLRNGKNDLPVYKDKQGKEYQGVVETAQYLPPLELMRFFTPFGVRAFNERSKIQGYHWTDSVNYKQEITDLLPALTGEIWIGVYIGNYDKGGHMVNLNLDYYPKQQRDTAERKNWVEPVFNTLNLMEMAGQEYATMFDNDSLTITVDIPEGLDNLSLRYITTGHGGWENGDEFNQKLNEIFMDGKKIFSFIPWRTDCGTYRMYNPSSGNFGDGLSSSDLSRSNWCPGTTTNPVYIPINDLTPGKHTFKIAIPLGKREGTSFSAWNISGCLLGEFK